MKPLTVIAITRAVAGQEQALRSAQEQLVAETLKEPGCLRYELHQSLQDPGLLVFVESWQSEEYWRAHMEGTAMRRFIDSGARQLIEKLDLHRMQEVTDD